MYKFRSQMHPTLVMPYLLQVSNIVVMVLEVVIATILSSIQLLQQINYRVIVNPKQLNRIQTYRNQIYLSPFQCCTCTLTCTLQGQSVLPSRLCYGTRQLFIFSVMRTCTIEHLTCNFPFWHVTW